MAKFYKENGQMRFFMASAVKKMAKFFKIGHEMANLATLTLKVKLTHPGLGRKELNVKDKP